MVRNTIVLQVNSNGILSFNHPFTICCGARTFPIITIILHHFIYHPITVPPLMIIPPPLIAPFWHDFDPTVAGRISYRQTNNTNQLNTVHQLFTTLDTGELRDFSPTHLFVATWDRVSQFASSSEVNTMSCMYDCKGILAILLY